MPVFLLQENYFAATLRGSSSARRDHAMRVLRTELLSSSQRFQQRSRLHDFVGRDYFFCLELRHESCGRGLHRLDSFYTLAAAGCLLDLRHGIQRHKNPGPGIRLASARKIQKAARSLRGENRIIHLALRAVRYI